MAGKLNELSLLTRFIPTSEQLLIDLRWSYEEWEIGCTFFVFLNRHLVTHPSLDASESYRECRMVRKETDFNFQRLGWLLFLVPFLRFRVSDCSRLCLFLSSRRLRINSRDLQPPQVQKPFIFASRAMHKYRRGP